MNAWPAVLLMALAVAGAILWFSAIRKQLWPAVAAAIVLGFAGYAWQGQPQLDAAPARLSSRENNAAEALLSMRSDMDSQFGAGRQWLILSDSYARKGDYRYAAAFLEAGLRKHPENGDLWAGLGLVLLLAADGKMSPPAELAFTRARKFAPINRSPDYITGIVALFEGRPATTLAVWQKLIDGAPKNAVWKPKLESQLQGLKTLLKTAQATDVK